MNYEEKKEALLEYIDELARNNIALAFSGGVDSSLLLKLCCDASVQTGSRVYAVTVHTELHPMNDLVITRRVAAEMGAEHIVVKLNEMEEAGITDNPVDRCYLCKKCLFTKLQAKARELGAPAVMDGTNEDDLHVYRPGIRALRELGIISPLAKFTLTKAEIRRMAAEYGISVASRPSAPCMATRFPYNTRLTIEDMHKAELGEEWIRARGFYNVRLRIYDKTARIEIDLDSFDKLLSIREELLAYLKELGYDYIALDLEGFRSGSMDIHVKDSVNQQA